MSNMVIRKNSGRYGFTLVEIVIIISAIAILSTIGVVSYKNMRQRAARASIVSALSDAQKKLELEYAQSRTTMGELAEAPEEVALTRVQKEGVHYSGLTDVQNGVLFHMVCLELIADPTYSTIHAKSGGNTASVVMRCDDNVSANSILITGWDSKTWNVPVTQATLESYIASVPADSWWIDRQEVVRGFYTQLIDRFTKRGGSWPVKSFWHPWAAPGNSGVPKEILPEPDPPEEGTYCIQGAYAGYPDMTYIITDQDGTPREGVCPTS